MLRRPILRRKGDAPESRAGRGKLQSYFRFAGTHRAEKHHLTFLFLLGAVVLHVHFASTGDTRLQQNQSSVRINGQCGCFLLKGGALRVLATDAHSHLHQDPLAPAAWTCVTVNVRRMAHKTSHPSIYSAGRESRVARKTAYAKRIRCMDGTIACP